MPTTEMPFVGNWNFLVEIDGVTGDSSMVVGGFSEVRGLGSETEVVDYWAGNSATPVRVPGKTRYSNIVLRRGVTNSNELFRWRRTVEQGSAEKRSGAIILLDGAMQERARWNFFDAWPCKYEAPELQGEGDSISVETLELCVSRVERVEGE